MATKSDEYNSLRQELLEHQSSRAAVLSLVLTAAATLFAISVQLHNPYLPLFALLLLIYGRMQITQTHYSIQRIASYIRIVLENGNPDLNWETGSYHIRNKSIQKNSKIRNVSPLVPIDAILTLTSIVAIALTALIPWLSPSQQSQSSVQPLSAQLPTAQEQVVPLIVALVVGLIWFAWWKRYDRVIKNLENMKVDDAEATEWKVFKEKAESIKKEQYTSLSDK
jgi:hypothetical protein